MNISKKIQITIGLFLMVVTITTHAVKLAIVIDDFGYRQHNEEQIILLSPYITAAVLPNSPNATKMAEFAHQNGNDVIIHLPMAPKTKQPLEVDTLFPSMTQTEIDRIVDEAVKKVPYAIGVNNHMGSLMSSDLAGMQKVMVSLSNYSLFFLDSRTIPHPQGIVAAKEYRIPNTMRDLFLDDSQNLKDVELQFDLAIKSARKNGQVIVIGHPYHSTLTVLKERLATLPEDIELVKVSSLLEYPPPIRFIDLLEKYQVWIEQSMLQYVILEQSNK